MKLRNKIAAITAAAMLAFTGVGFAAWTFTKNAEEQSVSITGKATAAIEAKELKVQDGSDNDVTNLYIICDAPEGQTGLLAGKGIYWATDDQGENEITSLTLIGSVNEDDNNIHDISKYVGHFSAEAQNEVSGKYVNIAAIAELDEEVTSADKDSDVTYVWTLPELSYNKVPTSVEEVNELQAEVNALDITLAFNFNVIALAD